jgi:hypothetical protein
MDYIRALLRAITWSYDVMLRRWLMLDELGRELNQPWTWLLLWLLAALGGFVLWRRFRHQAPERWSGIVRGYTACLLMAGFTCGCLALTSHLRAEGNERHRKLQFVLSEDVAPTPPEVAEPPLLSRIASEALVSTPWARRVRESIPGWNAEEYDDMPERISFNPDGSFEATYQQGACMYRGTFTLTADSAVPSWEGNPCAAGPPRLRGGSKGRNHFQWMERGHLMLRAEYYPATLLGEPGTFFIDPRIGMVKMQGQLAGKLQRGVPTPLAVTLWFTQQYGSRKLRSLSLAMRERLPPAELQGRKPRTQLLVSKDLGGRPINALRHTLQEQVVLTPEFSGPVELRVVLAFEDSILPHWLDRTYLVDVGEAP